MKDKFVPVASLVHTIVIGFKQARDANPDIQTVGDYIDSLKNSEVELHRDDYVKAANSLIAATQGSREDDVMETCYVGPTHQDLSNAAAR